MSEENLEQFMKQVADSNDLQAKIGKKITEDALVALGAEHGCEFSIEDVQASAELSDEELEGVSGGLDASSKDQYAFGLLLADVARDRRKLGLKKIKPEKLQATDQDHKDW